MTRKDKLVYWISTGIVCAVMVFSIINFIFNDHFPFPNGKEGAFVHLGLPGYFIAHYARGDARLSVLFVIDPLIFLVILIVSYRYFLKAEALARGH